MKCYKVSLQNIRDECTKLYRTDGVYLRTMFATAQSRIYYVFSDITGMLHIPYIEIEKKAYPSLTDQIYETALYEREIATMFGYQSVGHPSLKSLLLHHNWPVGTYPLQKSFKWDTQLPMNPKHGVSYTFETIEGEGIYEIPVGPVHAGIIEPGHFRFSVAGEEVISLEPMLGYVHKGIEKIFEHMKLPQAVRLSERVSGDSSFSHSLAFCQAIEMVQKTRIPSRAAYLRVIYAELERLANHLGDIGLILNDTGFNLGGSQGSIMREMVLRLQESLTGSRYMRGVNTVGGVTQDIDTKKSDEILDVLREIKTNICEVSDIVENSDSVMNRLKKTGTLSKQTASDHGVVGVAARASGLAIDMRLDHPYAAYADLSLKKSVHTDGDVYARYHVRVQEVGTSTRLITQALERLPKGKITSGPINNLPAEQLGVGMVEGWRGDIVYVVLTDAKGCLTRVVARDPSYLNWPAVAFAVPTNVVPDFPLINKSFNLSYSGFDR